MKITIATIGKLSQLSLEPLLKDYLRRINFYFSCELANFKSLDRFWNSFKRGKLIALDERGGQLTSVEFSGWIEGQQIEAVSELTFLVGPAQGIPEEIKSKTDLLLSLSKFTLQHEQALLILLEQLYRTTTIIRGEPYHKS